MMTYAKNCTEYLNCELCTQALETDVNCDSVSQTSSKVGPRPIWFYCKFRNFVLQASKRSIFWLHSTLWSKVVWIFQSVHFNVPLSYHNLACISKSFLPTLRSVCNTGSHLVKQWWLPSKVGKNYIFADFDFTISLWSRSHLVKRWWLPSKHNADR